jgi:hypothetical protein
MSFKFAESVIFGLLVTQPSASGIALRILADVYEVAPATYRSENGASRAGRRVTRRPCQGWRTGTPRSHMRTSLFTGLALFLRAAGRRPVRVCEPVDSVGCQVVCAIFETVVASQVSPPVGEQGKQDSTRLPSAERLPVKQGGPRVPDLKRERREPLWTRPKKGFAEAVAWPVAGDQAQRSGVCAMCSLGDQRTDAERVAPVSAQPRVGHLLQPFVERLEDAKPQYQPRAIPRARLRRSGPTSLIAELWRALSIVRVA